MYDLGLINVKRNIQKEISGKRNRYFSSIDSNERNACFIVKENSHILQTKQWQLKFFAVHDNEVARLWRGISHKY